MHKKMNFPRQKEEEEAHRRSSSPTAADADGDVGFFEFFNATDIGAEMCAAADIFHPWTKLQQKHGSRNLNTATFPKASADDDDDHTNTILLLKRASSLNNPTTHQQQQQMAMQIPRRAQSAKYVRSRTLDSSSSSPPQVAKPKWYLLMFGSMKKMMPGEMDMRDIRSRQNKRRNIPVPTPPSSVSKSRRKPLRGFSCKEDHATAVATVTLGCIPQF
ncbi:hypothetical protein ACLOJK_040568 [Asimina triloba]